MLELWTINRIYVDLWQGWLFVRRTGGDSIDGQATAIDKETDRSSYDLLCLQLRALAERQAGQLSKAVLNELERRLLQRTQGQWFETYLATICLLNCIESASWLFRTWSYDEYQTQVYICVTPVPWTLCLAKVSDGYLEQWPLDKTPLEFYQHSERFADMLHMLLRIRNLPPKTQESPLSGILLATANDDTVQRYFESIRISSTSRQLLRLTLKISSHDLLTTGKTLEERQEATFDPADSRSLELKFCAKLLLPS